MHPSSSDEQQSIEAVILKQLNLKLGLNLAPAQLSLSESAHVQLDGLDENKKTACEIYARVGKLKGSQPDKVASDLLKMELVERLKGGKWRKIFCFVDPQAAKLLLGKSWLAVVVKTLNVEIHVTPLGEAEREKLIAAQTRQVMVNK